MAESPEEKEALEKLDEVTREVSGQEMEKEFDREISSPWIFRGGGSMFAWFRGRFRVFRPPTWRDPVPEPLDDEDPAGGPSMLDVMHGTHVDEN